MSPRASGSQCGAPSPASAGTNTTPSLLGTWRASASISAAALHDPEPVAQPLHGRAGDEAAALERVADLVADLPADGRKQAEAARHRLAPVLTSTKAPVP